MVGKRSESEGRSLVEIEKGWKRTFGGKR